jgi:hypothetical protein
MTWWHFDQSSPRYGLRLRGGTSWLTSGAYLGRDRESLTGCAPAADDADAAEVAATAANEDFRNSFLVIFTAILLTGRISFSDWLNHITF